MIYQENFEKEVKGLFGLKKVKNVSISYKFIEQCCVEDYLSAESEHPEWNVQEQGADWPLEIKNQHAELQANAQSREKKIKRKEVNLN
ncbi:hypothetical protein C826_02400 [Helicobacter bilis WiWa]|uniref:Uncharacterized protein n=1 Tax=Helicobacter bilis WiWa TaxID=1235804 RepID=N2B851_9HELI|nr:hypothetical protein C826_02400 [Helicobacter bilis WiWa]